MHKKWQQVTCTFVHVVGLCAPSYTVHVLSGLVIMLQRRCSSRVTGASLYGAKSLDWFSRRSKLLLELLATNGISACRCRSQLAFDTRELTDEQVTKLVTTLKASPALGSRAGSDMCLTRAQVLQAMEHARMRAHVTDTERDLEHV